MEDSTVKRHERLRQLQRTNIDSWSGRQPKLDPKTLDSSMKKNTGFIKKCKGGMGQDNAAQLVREVRLLRLEKYVSEIVPAAFEGLAKCKAAADVSAAVDVMTALHARFPAQTTVPLIRQVLRALAPPGVAALAAMTADAREREEQGRLGRQRVLLRMLAEMHMAGLLWGIDANANGVDGMDRAAAFMLAHPAQAAAGSAAGASKLAARVKEAVQQPGYCVLVGALQNLLLADREHHLSILLAASFARTFKTDYGLSGDETLAASVCAISPGIGDAAAVVDAEMCRKLRALLNEYLDSAIEHLQTMHKALVRMRRNAEEKLFNKGVVYVEAKEKLEKHTRSFEKLCESVGMLCEPLGRTPPDLSDSVEGESQMDIVFDAPGVAKGGGQQGIWEDDEERTFYEALPDFRAQLPPSMLTSQRKKADKQQKGQDAAGAPSSSSSFLPAKSDEAGEEGGAGQPAEADGLADDAVFEEIDESAIDADVQGSPVDVPDDAAEDDAADSATALGLLEYQKFMSRRRRNDGADAEPGAVDTQDHAADGEGIGVGGVAAQPLSSRSSGDAGGKDDVQPLSAGGASQTVESRDMAEVLRRMPLFTNRDDVDQAALDFCCVNTRVNRGLLVRALLDVPRRQLFLVPYYARMVAVLHPYFPEISEAVVDELSHEFRWLVRQRFKDLMDTRIKNCRYLAELTKFKVAPLHVVYRCAKVLVEQLHAQNIEVLCALLEGCGRFLLAQSATAERVASLLDILMRKRRVMNLDDRTALLIENSCRACRPQQPGLSQHVKLRTPIERFIRKLIYEDLSRDSADRVCQKLRRLPWNDLSSDASGDPQRIRRTLINCFTKPWKIKHANVYLLTMVAGALCRLHPWFRMALVDTVLENIKLGLERSMFAHNQRRLAEMRYVGEMLIFRIVGSREIVELLYLIVRHGHPVPHPVPGRACAIDQADDYFRVRLACTLVQTCGGYMREAEERRALERFAVYLQMYVLAKDQPVPIDTEYCVESMFETVFPGLVRYETWQEAAQAMSDLIQGKMPAAASRSGEADSASSGHGPNNAADSLDLTLDPGMPMENSSGDYVDSDPGDAGADSGSQDASEDEETDPELEELLLQQRKEAEEAEMAEAKLQIEAVEALIEQEEEDILEAEFNRLLVDSSDPRKVDRASKLDVAVPMNLLGRSSAAQLSSTMFGLGSPTTPTSASVSAIGSSLDTVEPASPSADPDAIRFSLLTGKRQRPVVRAVHIPVESQIARNLRLQEEEAMRERAQLKRIVLDYERREAAEEMRVYEAARARSLGLSSARAGANTARFDGVYRRRAVVGANFVNKPTTGAPRRRNNAGSAVSPGVSNAPTAGLAQQKPPGN